VLLPAAAAWFTLDVGVQFDMAYDFFGVLPASFPNKLSMYVSLEAGADTAENDGAYAGTVVAGGGAGGIVTSTTGSVYNAGAGGGCCNDISGVGGAKDGRVVTAPLAMFSRYEVLLPFAVPATVVVDPGLHLDMEYDFFDCVSLLCSVNV